MKTITLPAFFDAHVHLRDGAMLRQVAPWTDACCGHCLVMPNLKPPVDSVPRLTQYQAEVRAALPRCRPLFTFQLTRTLDPDVLPALQKAGATAGKLYPRGLTTNSEHGFGRDDFESYPACPLGILTSRMADLGMILCLHGEMPGSFCLDRETAFLGFVAAVVERHPNLRVVMEHITTGPACVLVKRYPSQLAATVTLHHLEHTLDDVLGDRLRPHHFCKPIPKRPSDREALHIAALTMANVFLGSDSAPHLRRDKECDYGCAGVFTASVLAPRLVQLFEEWGGLDFLEDFTSGRGCKFYGLDPTNRTITLKKDPWIVHRQLGDVVPFLAGETLPWRLVD